MTTTDEKDEWETQKKMISMMKLSDEFRIQLIRAMLKEEDTYEKIFDRAMKDEIANVADMFQERIDKMSIKIAMMKENIAKMPSKADGLRRGVENLTKIRKTLEERKMCVASLNRENLFRISIRRLSTLLKDVPTVWKSRFLKYMQSKEDERGEHMSGDAYEDSVFNTIRRRLQDFEHLEVLQNVHVICDEIVEGVKSELDVIVIDRKRRQVVTLIEVKRSFVSLPSGLNNVPKIHPTTRFVLSKLKDRVELRSTKHLDDTEQLYSFSPDMHVVGVGFLIDEETCDSTIRTHLEASMISYLCKERLTFKSSTFDKTGDGVVTVSRPEFEGDFEGFSFESYGRDCWIFRKKFKEVTSSSNDTKTLVNDALKSAGFERRPILVPKDLMQHIPIESFVPYVLNSLASRRKMLDLLRSMK